MSKTHLLNLRVLAGEDVDDYALVRFEGREAISEPFDYHIELVATKISNDLQTGKWIGNMAEFDITTTDGGVRVFAGCIFDTRFSVHDEGFRVHVRIRPYFYRYAYDRGTKFSQDKTTREIFEAFTKGIYFLSASFSLRETPPTHGYSTQYDETALGYLSDLLARDGITYFFRYDKEAPFNHRMIVSNKESDFLKVEGGDEIVVHAGNSSSSVKSLEVRRQALPQAPRSFGLDANNLDNIWLATASPTFPGQMVGTVWDTLGNAALAEDCNSFCQTVEAHTQGLAAESVSGFGDNPGFCAGGRVNISLSQSDETTAYSLVLSTVSHSAYDPWMLDQGGGSEYSNSFEAKPPSVLLQPTPKRNRRTSGPIVGVVHDGTATVGTVVVDKQSRIPVRIEEAVNTSNLLNEFVWLPVQQQWAHSTHGAQFFPRIGTHVIIDFLYGNPDLPIVVGTFYTPTQKYPFDPASKSTQSGWRSVSDKNGKIRQEFHFEDKPGKEEVYLYTGRNYRRQIDADDFGTVGHDQTLLVQHDQMGTVDNDQTLEVGRNQSETIKNNQTLTVNVDQSTTVINNQTLKVDGEQDTKVKKTRTITVEKKNLLESKEEIELKVGPCSIKMTMQGIVIEAPQIEIKATAMLKTSAGAMAEHKAPMIQSAADAMHIVKGGIVMIN